jgi:hypothetical protein
MRDDLVFGFLDLHQVPEFGRPIRFAIVNDLGMRLKYTHQLFADVGVAAEHPRFGLPNHLLHSSDHGLQLLPR